MTSELVAAIEAQQLRLDSKHNELDELYRSKQQLSKEVSQFRMRLKLAQHEVIQRMKAYLKAEWNVSFANLLLEKYTGKCAQSEVILRSLRDVSELSCIPSSDNLLPCSDISKISDENSLRLVDKTLKQGPISIKKVEMESKLREVQEEVIANEGRVAELKDSIAKHSTRQEHLRRNVSQRASRVDQISSKLSIANDQIDKLRARLGELQGQLANAKEVESQSREALRLKRQDVQSVLRDLQDLERRTQTKRVQQNEKQIEQRLVASNAALQSFQSKMMKKDKDSSPQWASLESSMSAEKEHGKRTMDDPRRTAPNTMKKPRMVRTNAHIQ